MKLSVRSFAEVVAVVSVVLSLVFVGIELRLNRQVAASEVMSQNTEMTTILRSLIIENSDVWVRGCAGEDLAIVDQAIYSQLVGTVATYYFSYWQRALNGISPANADRWPLAMALNMHRYEGFNQTFRRTEAANSGGHPLAPFANASLSWISKIEIFYEDLSQNGEIGEFGTDLCGL